MTWPAPLVMTCGVFDILHPGHVDCLEAARALGETLVVGINSDESARQLDKGPGRPINTAEDRARVISALHCVSTVVVFDEPTPAALIFRLRPDVFVKGGDYDADTLPEASIVRAYGGKVVIVPYRAEYSTTAMVQRIRG